MKNKTLNITVIILLVLFFLYAGVRAKQNKEAGTTPSQFDTPRYAERGSYSVGTKKLVIENDQGLEMTVWYPAADDTQIHTNTNVYEIKMGKPFGTVSIASSDGQAIDGASYNLSDGPFPLVILSPGFSIGSTSYAWLAEHLASYGFVVISPEHQEHLDPEDQLWRSAVTRPLDILSVFAYLDEQVKSRADLEGVVNPDLAAVVGHSYGGYTTLASAGAKIDTAALGSHCQNAIEEEHEAAWLCEMLIPHLGDMAELAGLEAVPDGLWPAAADPRVDAIVSMAGDAFFFGEDGLAEINVPLMAIGGTADKDSPYTWSTQPAYEYSSSSRKIEIELQGAEHMIFTASCENIRWYLKFLSGEFCKDSTWDRSYAHALTKHFATAFLLTELKHDQNAEITLYSENIDLADVTYKADGYQ